MVAVAALALAACSSSGASGGGSGSGGSGGSGSPSAATAAAACATSGGKGSAKGVTATTVRIGLLADLTGVASSSFSDTPLGVQARLDAQNAKGGVCGRKLELITADAASSPSQALTAAQNLVNKGVFAVVSNSSLLFGAFRYLQQQGIPVTGPGIDGPEWGQKPNTNMFSYNGGLDPGTPAYTTHGMFLKSIGVTNVGAIAYGISPAAVNQTKALKKSLESQGLRMGYENLSFPFGGVDFTGPILAMKKAGVDAAVCYCVQSSNIAMINAARQAGLDLKAAYSQSYADSSLFESPTTTAAAQGAYFATTTPLDQGKPAVDTFVANLKQYSPKYKGGYPSLGVTSGYLATDLMIKGLEVAGKDPTRESFISGLTKVTSYDADGLLPSPVGFDHFGKANKQLCFYFVQVKGSDFVTINGGKRMCGDLIPNSQVS
ncbi:ABC transporter substrate-binding protein [Frankia gtarii]|uniref:ABC transporter substrate-binding protein n=1 Tax=Frankia gtarii TaxID=2950102 RepID=UPI0021C0A61E|nr:ABC transporter substrate-binding protein [Frankia gtarii]